MSIPNPETSPVPEARSRTWNWRRTVVVTVLVIVVLGVAAGLTWWTHPEAFESGAGAEAKLKPVSLDDTPFYVGFAHSGTDKGSETVTLRSVRARLRDNTSKATVSVTVCTRRPVAEGTLALGNGTAADTPDLGRYCTTLRAVRPGTKMQLNDGRQYLIATIAPTRPGRAVLASVDLSYSRGMRHLYQRGTQRIEIDTLTTLRVSD